MKKIFVIIDGLGDRPIKKLGDKTPLEYAKTPSLDYFSSEGCNGYVYTINKKIAPESDEAVWALLGNDPFKSYSGRGPLEAYGAGLKFKDGNLALRTNFSTVKGDVILDRRVGRTLRTTEAKVLGKAINSKVKLDKKFVFLPTIGHRGVLLIKGKNSSNISNVDSAYKKVGAFGVAREAKVHRVLKCEALDNRKLSKETADIVNDFVEKAREVLDEHALNKKRVLRKELKANAIVPRDAGVSLSKPRRRYLRWGAIVAMPLEIGISKLCGIKVVSFSYPPVKSKNVYESLYSGLRKTIKESLKVLNEGKFKNYYLHFKEADVCGHDGRYKDKVKMIEILDSEFFSKLKSEFELVVTADHSTPCDKKVHSSDPVPILWYGGEKDNVCCFSERECSKGSLGKIYGKDVLVKVGFLR